jgi:hypothetical protein
MARKSFKSILRSDLKVRKAGRFTEVSGGGLTYRLDRANKETAALVNSKIPVAVIRPPMQ